MSDVTLYVAAGCPRCEDARRLLHDLGVQFREVDVATDPVALHRVTVYSGTPAVPAVDVGGEVLVGFDRERIEALVRG